MCYCMHIVMKRKKYLKFYFFFINFADHSKFRLLALMVKLLDPDPHSEVGSGSRGQIKCGSGSATQPNRKSLFIQRIVHLGTYVGV